MDADGVLSVFVYGGEGIGGAPDLMVKDGAPYRIVKDHLGSVRLVVHAESGVVAQQLDYDAFGRVLGDTAPGFQPFAFAGGLYDEHTKLVRFGARDYDPGMGRWTTKDPIGFAGGQANVYVYVGNDPVNGVDPTGLEVWIFLGFTEIDGACGVIACAHHAYVIFWDTELEEWYATRAGPGRSVRDGEEFGRLVAEAGPWNDEFVDRPRETVQYQFVGKSDAGLGEVSRHVRRFNTAVNTEQKVYNPLFQNSNTYANAMLMSLGWHVKPRHWSPAFSAMFWVGGTLPTMRPWWTPFKSALGSL